MQQNQLIIIIQKATCEDLAEILKIQKEAFLSEAEIYNDYSFDALTQTTDSIQSDYTKYIFLKAVYNNKIVGSVKGRITDGYGFIGRLIVRPEFQNRGIARQLMHAIEKEISEAAYFVLFTGSKSTKNIQLYESIGYTIADTYTDDKNPSLILVKMCKKNERK